MKSEVIDILVETGIDGGKKNCDPRMASVWIVRLALEDHSSMFADDVEFSGGDLLIMHSNKLDRYLFLFLLC
jgi:hypothetical protein